MATGQWLSSATPRNTSPTETDDQTTPKLDTGALISCTPWVVAMGEELADTQDQLRNKHEECRRANSDLVDSKQTLARHKRKIEDCYATIDGIVKKIVTVKRSMEATVTAQYEDLEGQLAAIKSGCYNHR